MASTENMSLPAFRPTLAHTYNSRGELGMFVNPWACSCETCVDHVASRSEAAPAPTPTPVSLTTLPPPPPISEMMAAEALVQLHRSAMFSPAPALARTITGFHYRPSDDDDEEDGIGPTESVAYTGLPALAPSATGSWVAPTSPGLAPAPTGGLGLASRFFGAVRFWTPEEAPSTVKVELTPTQMATLKSSLQEFTEYLTEQQNECDHSGCRSHDEMAAEDERFDELDRKIMEIDEILAVLAAAE